MIEIHCNPLLTQLEMSRQHSFLWEVLLEPVALVVLLLTPVAGCSLTFLRVCSPKLQRLTGSLANHPLEDLSPRSVSVFPPPSTALAATLMQRMLMTPIDLCSIWKSLHD
jgi:hypothetical protein